MSQKPLNSLRRTRIIDVRGREHLMLRVEDVPEMASAELKQAVRVANAHRWTVQLRYTALSIAGSLVLVWAFFRVFRTGFGLWPWALYILLNVISGVLVGSSRIKAAAVKAFEMCRAEGLCPACGYSIAGLQSEENGCTVCPECGGSWKV